MIGNQRLWRGSFLGGMGRLGGLRGLRVRAALAIMGQVGQVGRVRRVGTKKLPLVRQLNSSLYTNYLIIHHLHQSSLKTL